MSELLARISINPQIRFGKPCIRGTRIWVALVLDFLAAFTIFEEILRLPQLQYEFILDAIAYGVEISRERYVDLPDPSAA